MQRSAHHDGPTRRAGYQRQGLEGIADEKETEKLKEVLARRQKEEEEERRARQDFMEREIRPDGIERFNGWVRRAAEQGRTEIEILRFPSQYCTDHGRAINNFEQGWPDTLTGAARKVYDAYVQHLQGQGYKIRAQILNYPDGGLGEVGIYIGW
jgi:cyclopropane fatty-acyl-phospholipid synthase-like methyltransferase